MSSLTKNFAQRRRAAIEVAESLVNRGANGPGRFAGGVLGVSAGHGPRLRTRSR